MTISKADIISQMRLLDPSQSRAQHTSNLDAALKVLTNAFAEGTDVTISGFGRFKIREVAARQARNPRTGGIVEIPAQKKLVFKPAPCLKACVNK